MWTDGRLHTSTTMHYVYHCRCEDNCGFEASPNIPIVVRGVFDIFDIDKPWLVFLWTVLVEGVEKVDVLGLVTSYHDTPNIAYVNTRKLLPSINYWIMVERKLKLFFL